MISRKTICFFLCSTVFFQQQYCSPVPTNRKIRHDMRRNSLSDQSEESTSVVQNNTIEESKPTTVRSSSAEVTNDNSESTTIQESTVPSVNSISDEDIIKLSDIFKIPVSEHTADRVKRYITSVNSNDREGKRELSFKPEQAQDELLEVAEVHLFKPLFKYKLHQDTRKHTGRQPFSTTKAA
ncbi:uncharacterized protein LOC131691846 [Topomyia yanbarensis]|uniref:uncharacterized protein LOC131691846 n=1 Tax=Topomyia yanbarensis TaxID=2498891 RepID=UPI00273C5B98|nr:uncharacterized protein LOC131691846 [Topomyia yanbarensis]